MRKLVIEVKDSGQVHITNAAGGFAFGANLNKTLGKFCPHVPDEAIDKAAEVIDTALGEDTPGQSWIHEGVLSG